MLALVMVASLTFSAAAQERGVSRVADTGRVALVIGNGGYVREEDRLANPPNDARAVASELAELGFSVIEAIDLDVAGMRRQLGAFGRALQDADVGLLFYAGHGFEYQGRNYLVPVDATLEAESDVFAEMLPLDDVLRVMETTVPTRLIILDACRNNPMARRLRRSLGAGRSTAVGEGLAEMRAAVGTLIAYATAPGEVALDGAGGNSPFTTALLEHLGTPGLEAELMLKRVRVSVLEATDSRQVPWVASSISGSFFFARGEPAAAPEPTPAPAIAPVASGAPADELWDAIEGSTNAGEWQLFAELFPDDPRTPLARFRADEYREDAPEPVPAAPDVDAQLAALPPEASEDVAPAAGPATAATENRLPLGRADWRRIQQSLNILGFAAGEADGLPGQRTREALAAWQSAKGATATGYLDGTQYRALLAEAEPQLAALEAARQESGAPTAVGPAVGIYGSAPRWAPGEVFRECDACPEMVVVPPGSFVMGSPPDEEGRRGKEGPQHRVAFAAPFAIARTEVTFDQWAACVADGGCNGYRPDDYGWGRGHRPVIHVSWDDAQAFVAWLNGQVAGDPYRLPSEAEWEYAARAGSTAAYPWGPFYSSSSAYCGPVGKTPEVPAPREVGTYPANRWGLHDTSGNVWEWTEDRWHDSYAGAPEDGSAWLVGDSPFRVARGGSVFSGSWGCRSASRGWYRPDTRYNDVGFRPARDRE